MTEKDPKFVTAGNGPLLRDVMEMMSKAPAAAGRPEPPRVAGRVTAAATRTERWEHFRCRVGSFRDSYRVEPGLYAFGEPDEEADVLVSANYKLSFDTLRSGLDGHDFWILVLDTRGINVWCAAGKGTFGTRELVRRILETQLADVVKHRRLILPQLGAPGVNAREVRQRTGFKARFGPVRAADIPAYVKAGYRKTAAMSTVRFGIRDRLVLTPMELNPALKKYPWFAAAALLLFGLGRPGIIFADAWSGGFPFLLLGLVAVLAGAFLTPVLLPYIPGRSFAVKGWLAGLASMLAASFLPVVSAARGDRLLLAAAWLLFPALSSYLALQFTGSTTFTGMSGVKKELKFAVPLYIAALAASILLLIAFKLTAWGIL